MESQLAFSLGSFVTLGQGFESRPGAVDDPAGDREMLSTGAEGTELETGELGGHLKHLIGFLLQTFARF